MNDFDFDGNRHGRWVERNPDGSIKRQGIYVHGRFFTGNGRQKKQDPVRREVLRALGALEQLPCQSAQQKGRLKHVQQSIALLFKSLKQHKR